MNFLSDESCAGPVIRALRQAGHDVIAICEVAKGSPDEHVLRRALDEGRVLITEDLDFGRLVYAQGRPNAGVLLVRFHSRARLAEAATVAEAVANSAPGCKTPLRWWNPAVSASPPSHDPGFLLSPFCFSFSRHSPLA